MSVSFYPAQRVRIGGTELPLVQSASIEFNTPKTPIYKNGQFTAVNNIITETPTSTFNVTYALTSDGSAPGILGTDSISTLLNDFTIGKNCVIEGAGTVTMTKGFLTEFSVKGSVGDIVVCSASFEGLNTTFSPANADLNNTRNPTVAEAKRPDQISVSLGVGNNYACRSFSYTVNSPRENIILLGNIVPTRNIPSDPPNVKIEAEIIMNSSVPIFDRNTKYTPSINCGGIIFSLVGAKLTSFNTEASLEGVEIATIVLEKTIEDLSDISIGG